MLIDSVHYIGMGCFIKSRRIALGISKEVLAYNLNITTELLDRWEKEDLDNIGITEMKELAKALKYYPLIFIKGVPEMAYEDWDNFINQKYIGIN